MHLLDGGVLIALVAPEHIHHGAARRWMGKSRRYAICPTTQGTLLRHLLREGFNAADAWASLARVTSQRRHEYWPDDATYLDVPLTGVIGHRQVTDAYLAHQARQHGAMLATLDRGLAALHPDVVELVPT